MASRSKYDELWVSLNWKIHLPTKETHPDFPLWQLGYSSQEVYDLFFPEHFRFLCNPSRPVVCGRFGLPQERPWRFEFVVAATEDGMEMAKPHMIKSVVCDSVCHASGESLRVSLCGRPCIFAPFRQPHLLQRLDAPVEFPEDCIEVFRSRPFRFSARSCNKWALGRVILCGDSAHVFPPCKGHAHSIRPEDETEF